MTRPTSARITTTGRNAWTDHSTEQRARLIRDMPLVPMDEPQAGIHMLRSVLIYGGGLLVLFLAAFAIIAEGVHL